MAKHNLEGRQFVWVCNECGCSNFTDSVAEDDLDWLSCIDCGGSEFHREDADGNVVYPKRG